MSDNNNNNMDETNASKTGEFSAKLTKLMKLPYCRDYFPKIQELKSQGDPIFVGGSTLWRLETSSRKYVRFGLYSIGRSYDEVSQSIHRVRKPINEEKIVQLEQIGGFLRRSTIIKTLYERKCDF